MRCFYIILVFITYNFDCAAQDIMAWTGSGDGVSWEDANNWEETLFLTKRVPLSTDLVLIAGPADSITINSAAVARSMVLFSHQILHLESGSLSIDNNECTVLIGCGVGLLIDDSKLIVNENTVLNIEDTDLDAIDMSNMSAIINKGTITIKDSESDGIFNIGPSGTSIVNDGSITITDVDGEAMNFNGKDSIENNGTILIEDADEAGIDLDGNQGVFLINNGIITINDIDDEEGIDMDGTNARLVNNGTINISDLDSEEAIDLDGTGSSFENNGTINISEVKDSEAIDISTRFDNNGLINVGNSVSTTDEAIDIGPTGVFNQSRCAVTNVTSSHMILIEGTFQNNGTLTTIYTGANTLTGMFVNNGLVATSSGSINVAPGVITGTGKMASSPIPAPAQFLCIKPVPTLSQWSILILALVLLIIGTAKISTPVIT